MRLLRVLRLAKVARHSEAARFFFFFSEVFESSRELGVVWRFLFFFSSEVFGSWGELGVECGRSRGRFAQTTHVGNKYTFGPFGGITGLHTNPCG